MRNFATIAFLALFACMVSAVAWGLDFPVNPSNHINDYAEILTPEEELSLNQSYQDFENRTGVQIFVALFKTIEGEDISDLSTRIFEKWKPGNSKQNNGILLVLGMQERAVRVEVGYGLEDKIPDAYASRIIREDLAPFFKEMKYFAAFSAFKNRVENILRNPNSMTARQKRVPVGNLSFIALLVIVFFIRLVSSSTTFGSRHGVRRRHGLLGMGGWPGGGLGGGGGFGGFSGGGGGLSGGGGASGRW